jgi:hypothetical protein
MLRVLLIVWLALAAPLQSLGTGTESARDAAEIAISMVVAQVHDGQATVEAKSHCCDEAKLAQDRAAPCSSDCKAVMAMANVPSAGTPTDHGALYRAPDESLHRTVDLRPPIS